MTWGLTCLRGIKGVTVQKLQADHEAHVGSRDAQTYLPPSYLKQYQLKEDSYSDTGSFDEARIKTELTPKIREKMGLALDQFVLLVLYFTGEKDIIAHSIGIKPASIDGGIDILNTSSDAYPAPDCVSAKFLAEALRDSISQMGDGADHIKRTLTRVYVVTYGQAPKTDDE